MNAASDIYHGWITLTGVDGVKRDFYLRQLWDGKGSAIVEAMEPDAMEYYAGICGWTLARAHARSGDAIAIASYLGTSTTGDEAFAAFAAAYADQNEADYAALKAAADAGTITVQYGL
jgi:sugar/nucleoside kinase (ribokinase family)